ncbi:MAG: hypothetical protein KHY08_11350 [Lachnospiraceae bacterium]|nr:hypothetical protein [Lachnospiraceae bacterium]
MAKRIKFPLIMKNGAEVRDIDGLRERFDMESVAEYFFNGKLEKWLENNYYDDLLEKIQELDKDEPDLGSKIAYALGVKWNGNDSDIQRLLKQAELKEQLKPYVSEEELDRMEYIADTQEELECLARLGNSPIYLYGGQFTIREWMENIECIGIQNPTVSVEISNPDEYRKKKLRLSKVSIDDKEINLMIQESEYGIYYRLLKMLESYLDFAKDRK